VRWHSCVAAGHAYLNGVPEPEGFPPSPADLWTLERTAAAVSTGRQS